jgi:hypothetical protein
MDKLTAKYNIPFQDADNVHCANSSEHTAAQYMGFMQGFKWAVYLLTGYKSEGVDKNVLASQS